LRSAFLFGMLVFGNIVDNIGNPKKFAIALQFLLAVSWLGCGIQIALYVGSDCN